MWQLTPYRVRTWPCKMIYAFFLSITEDYNKKNCDLKICDYAENDFQKYTHTEKYWLDSKVWQLAPFIHQTEKKKGISVSSHRLQTSFPSLFVFTTKGVISSPIRGEVLFLWVLLWRCSSGVLKSATNNDLLTPVPFTVKAIWSTHPQQAHQHNTHTHTHTHTHVGFCGLWGLSIGVMVFILYNLYVLLPYTYPTPKLSPHRRLCAFLDFQKNTI